tara:strand:+ start:89 stop:2644 length:2556 start_codon:yes stop_codon:yes gene_type:complete
MLNPYFQQGSRSEQNLIQDLINEQLKMYGVEIHYLPRKYLSEKTVLKEVIQSKFDDAYPIEAYIENYEGYGDNNTILSKFGIQATNEITLIISKERFETYISPLIKNEENIKLSTRPKEGDLLYFPLGDRLFEIKFVEVDKPFYQLQKTYVYELRCELYRVGDEVIDTGIEEIDDVLTGGESDGQSEDGISTLVGHSQTLTLIGTGSTATATSGIVNGGIRFIAVTNRGGGYLTPPRVAISSAPDGGVTGIATASMIGGIILNNQNANPKAQSVQQVQILNSGSGYTNLPGVKFISNTGSGAIATVGISTTGGVGIVTLTTPGAGYATSPTVTFSAPKHVGAAATATLDSPIVGGGVSVVSATISIGASAFLFPGGTTGGVFYRTAPTVTFALPTGTGNASEATATLDELAQTGGTVETLAITTGGKFYTSAPTVTISHPGTSTAAATVGLAGSSIDSSSVAFSTTGRAYTTAPTVTIGTGIGTVTPLVTAVGIATIDPITGIVTAVGFNSTTDSWCVGTGATIGLGYTVTPTISFTGNPSPVQATATVTVSAAGTVNTISIGNSGFGYLTAPTVSIASPGGADENFRALGFATFRSTSIKTEGTVGIGSSVITGITTTNIIVGDRVRLGVGYSDSYNFIPAETFVSSIGSGTLTMSASATNVGIATSVFEFGRPNCGVVTGIAVTFGGGGYLTPPVVSISNTVGDKNYTDFPGISTATGISTVSSAGTISHINILNAGFGYVIEPEVTISDPNLNSSGDFVFNEIVTGSSSGTTARVKVWNSTASILEVYNVDGTFTLGENIVGSTSGATHGLRKVDLDPEDDGFADNLDIETEADSILDFSEQNPFGIP